MGAAMRSGRLAAELAAGRRATAPEAPEAPKAPAAQEEAPKAPAPAEGPTEDETIWQVSGSVLSALMFQVVDEEAGESPEMELEVYLNGEESDDELVDLMSEDEAELDLVLPPPAAGERGSQEELGDGDAASAADSGWEEVLSLDGDAEEREDEPAQQAWRFLEMTLGPMRALACSELPTIHAELDPPAVPTASSTVGAAASERQPEAPQPEQATQVPSTPERVMTPSRSKRVIIGGVKRAVRKPEPAWGGLAEEPAKEVRPGSGLGAKAFLKETRPESGLSTKSSPKEKRPGSSLSMKSSLKEFSPQSLGSRPHSGHAPAPAPPSPEHWGRRASGSSLLRGASMPELQKPTEGKPAKRRPLPARPSMSPPGSPPAEPREQHTPATSTHRARRGLLQASSSMTALAADLGQSPAASRFAAGAAPRPSASGASTTPSWGATVVAAGSTPSWGAKVVKVPSATTLLNMRDKYSAKGSSGLLPSIAPTGSIAWSLRMAKETRMLGQQWMGAF